MDNTGFYPIVKRAYIREKNRDPVYLFKVMKFENEKFIGSKYQNDDYSDDFSLYRRKEIDFKDGYIYGDSDDMASLFPFVYIFEYRRSSPSQSINIVANDTSKYIVILNPDYKDVTVNFIQDVQQRNANRLNFLIGKLNKSRNKIEYGRMQSSVDRRDSVLIGGGDRIIIIDSQFRHNINMSRPLLIKNSYMMAM